VQPPEPTNTADSSITPTSPLESESKDANTVKPEESKDEQEKKVQDSIDGAAPPPEGEGKTPETPATGTKPATATEDKDVGGSKPAEILESAPAVTPLSPPKDLKFLDKKITVNSASLVWSPVDDADDYQVQYKIDGDDFWMWADDSWKKIEVQEKKGIKANNLDPGTKYNFQVRATNKKGNESVWSKYESVVTLPSPPKDWKIDAPTINSVSHKWSPVVGANRYKVQWFPADGEDGYPVQVSIDDKDVTGREKGVTEKETTVNGLKPCTEYKFRVCAVNESGDSTWSDTKPVVTLPPPPEKLDICDRDTTADSISLKWSPVDGANGYDVQYRKDGDSWSEDHDHQIKVKTPEAIISGLALGTKYTFRVRATNKNGGGSEWTESKPETTKSWNGCIVGCGIGVVLLALVWVIILVALWMFLPDKPATLPMESPSIHGKPADTDDGKESAPPQTESPTLVENPPVPTIVRKLCYHTIQ